MRPGGELIGTSLSGPDCLRGKKLIKFLQLKILKSKKKLQNFFFLKKNEDTIEGGMSRLFARSEQ